MSTMGSKRRILILGGGFGGAYAAQELCRSRGDNTEIVLIDRKNYLLFSPLLVQAGVGEIEPRHVTAPLRKFMKGGIFIMAEVSDVDTTRGTVSAVATGTGETFNLPYDELIIALGSEPSTPDIKGFAQFGLTFNSLHDAIALRDRAIQALELANSIRDPEERAALLTFVVVGGGYTGVELAGEYHALLCKAAKDYPWISEDEIRVMIFEITDRILPTMPPELADWAATTLLARGIEIVRNTGLKEVGADFVVTDKAQRIATRTTIWAGGIEPNSILKKIEVPKDQRGYVRCDTCSRVLGFQHVWAIGDAASMEDSAGNRYPATAQVATRQGPAVARNVVASMRGEALTPLDFHSIGAFASIGRHTAVAQIKSTQLKGFWAWLICRATYLMKFPTWATRVRVAMDWLLDLVLPQDHVQLGLSDQPLVVTHDVIEELEPLTIRQAEPSRASLL